MRRVAILNDYQGVARDYADWTVIDERVQTEQIREHISDSGKLIDALRPFHVIVAMRERTALPREVIEQLPNLEQLATAGIRVAEIDASAIESKQDLMADLSDALVLPDYFGGNWDALDEVLRDLGWLEADGHVLVVGGAEALRASDAALIDGLARSWISAVEQRWGAQGVPFHLLLVA